MMTLEVDKSGYDRRDKQPGSAVSRKLVLVASGQSARDGAISCTGGVGESSRAQPSAIGPSVLRCARVTATR